MTGDLTRLMIADDASGDGLDVALTKALRLAPPEGRILLFRSCYDGLVDEPDEVMPPATRNELREALTAREQSRIDAVVRAHSAQRQIETRAETRVETRVVWTRDAAGAIVEAAAAWPAQLLIKPVSRHHPVADYFHTPLDWALMRRAPCPVLVSKADGWQPPAVVLAALDAGDNAHAGLCREILRQAARLAVRLDADLHVVSVYPDLGQTVNELQVASDFAGIKADMREARHRAVTAMAGELGVTMTQLHVLEGPAGATVADLAGRIGAAVTVLGTAARGGVAKLLIGNTAEDLIGRIPGDLITVREPWS